MFYHNDTDTINNDNTYDVLYDDRIIDIDIDIDADADAVVVIVIIIIDFGLFWFDCCFVLFYWYWYWSAINSITSDWLVDHNDTIIYVYIYIYVYLYLYIQINEWISDNMMNNNDKMNWIELNEEMIQR